MKNVKDYPIINQLPNPFQKEDGSFITTVEEWQEQKEYYKKVLQEVLYGTIPEKVKYESFECVKKEECFNGKAIYEEIVIYLSEDKKYSFPAKIYYPKAEGKYPFIVWNYGSERDKCPVLEEAVCQRNFGVAMFSRDDLAIDDTEERMLDILYPECTWGNPYGTLVAWRAAQEVFHFHGCNNHNLIHYREGGHSFSKVDWNALLDCYDMIFREKTVETKLIYFDDTWYKKEGKPDWMADRLHYEWEAPSCEEQ